MLITTAFSRADKTAGCAVTYRAAPSRFKTCPDSCPLKPAHQQGTATIDRPYLDALLAAVPHGGSSWTYTHFQPQAWIQRWRNHVANSPATTTINASADTYKQAARTARAGIPTVLAAPADRVRKTERRHGARFVQCPATYNKALSCRTCGGATPLCARATRDYVIVFPSHGATGRLVGSAVAGGCYADGGNVRLHWDKLSKRSDTSNDATRIADFARSLPPGTALRHHVAGDIGKDTK